MLRGRLLRRALLAALVISVPAACPAQFRFIMKRNQPPLPIDEATSNAVIDQALKRLEAEYVFPDVAAQMTQSLRKRQADKAYAGIKTGQALAQQLTKDLQAVSKDKHLRIVCSTETLPKLPGGSGPNPDPTSQMKEEMRQMGQWMK